MQPTNHTGKEFTDEQWDDLLSKTFGPATPSTNIPETKPPEPEPIAETTTPLQKQRLHLPSGNPES